MVEKTSDGATPLHLAAGKYGKEMQVVIFVSSGVIASLLVGLVPTKTDTYIEFPELKNKLIGN